MFGYLMYNLFAVLMILIIVLIIVKVVCIIILNTIKDYKTWLWQQEEKRNNE